MKATQSKRMKEILKDESDARTVLKHILRGKESIRKKGGIKIDLKHTRISVRQLG